MRAAGGEAPEALWSGSREPWGTFCNVGSSGGSPTHCLPLPQEKRLSTESGLSADSHLSAGTASQGEPEGPLAEEEGLSQQEPVPATQEEVMEETYEEVRLALGAACSGAGLPAPTLPPCPSSCAGSTSRFFQVGPQVHSSLCGAQQESGCPRPGGGLGEEGLYFKAGSAWALLAHATAHSPLEHSQTPGPSSQSCWGPSSGC